MSYNQQKSLRKTQYHFRLIFLFFYKFYHLKKILKFFSLYLKNNNKYNYYFLHLRNSYIQFLFLLFYWILYNLIYLSQLLLEFFCISIFFLFCNLLQIFLLIKSLLIFKKGLRLDIIWINMFYLNIIYLWFY